MTPDLAIGAGWAAVLATAGLATNAARRAGVPGTYLRDALHVGTGLWVLGWPAWGGPAVPIALVALALATVLAVPFAAPRVGIVARFRDAICGEGERWAGVPLYVLSYAVLTTAVFTGIAEPFPAGAALLALSLGDGIGGLIGRRWGRVRYRVPWGRTKSLEGSVTVAGIATLAILVAALRFGATPAAALVVAAGIVAAIAEALAPASTDNVLLPAAVWLMLAAASGGVT